MVIMEHGVSEGMADRLAWGLVWLDVVMSSVIPDGFWTFISADPSHAAA